MRLGYKAEQVVSKGQRPHPVPDPVGWGHSSSGSWKGPTVQLGGVCSAHFSGVGQGQGSSVLGTETESSRTPDPRLAASVLTPRTGGACELSLTMFPYPQA